MAEYNKPGASHREQCRGILIDHMEYKYTLPILTDKKTGQYVKMSKIMLFVRASGNQSRACINKLRDKYMENCFVSRADCFSDQGRKLEAGEIRTCCRDRVKRNCLQGKNLIIIETFCFDIVDVRYFSALAKQLRYVIVVEPWRTGQTGPPKNQRAGHSNFGNDDYVSHLFFGWFLNAKDSYCLREEVVMYMEDCVDQMDEFASMLRRCNAFPNFGDYYNFGASIHEQDLAFCLTKFCDSSYLQSRSYLTKLESSNAYGHVAKLLVCAFIVSHKVVGAKIKLKFKQKDLKQIDLAQTKFRVRDPVGQEGPLTPAEVNSSPTSASKSTLDTLPSEHYSSSPVIWGQRQSAVLTLGHASDVNHQQALQMLSNAVDREEQAAKHHGGDDDMISMNRSFVKRYGQYWIIYLKDCLTVDAIMASEIIVQ